MKIIDCKSISNKLRAAVADEIAKSGIQPHLVVIAVGSDEASAVYARSKQKACDKVGILCDIVRFPNEVTTEELVNAVNSYGTDTAIDAIMVELPLPKHIDKDTVLNAIPADKDVDCLSAMSMGKLIMGQKGFAPCTPLGVVKLFGELGEPLTGRKVCIVNRSNIIGKPLAAMMTARDATVTVCHSKTKDIAKYTKDADVVVIAVSHPDFLNFDMVKDGAIVVDVAVNVREDGTLCGDVAADVDLRSGMRTPVPGGVGLMTTTMMLQNTLAAAQNRASKMM